MAIIVAGDGHGETGLKGTIGGMTDHLCINV